MSQTALKHSIIGNAVSNYLRTIVALTVGLVTFRLLYQSMDKSEFGFWSLLWSVFGFGSMMDFGFGFAAQKRVAELSVHRQWEELGRVLSSILGFYGLMALVMCGAAFGAGDLLLQAFHVPAERTAEFHFVLVLFFAGIALAFPLGLFPEILRGQQRITLVNGILIAAMVSRLALVWWATHHHWGFTAYMLIALGFTLLPDVIAAPLALKHMPEVKLSLRAVSLRSLGNTASFSIFAYIGTCTNLILGKTDQLVLASGIGIGAVALYQAAGKAGEVFRDFTKQLQDALSPAAARLHAMGEHAVLGQMLVKATRWSIIVATPLYLLCAFYLDEVLRVLTGEQLIERETYLTAQVLLFWYYTTILTHSVSKRIFIMTGHERRLMWLGLGEAAANLAISVTLVLATKSVISVAIGSLIPTLYFGWVHLWPWMAREGGMTSWELLKSTTLPVLAGSAPMAVLLLVVAFVPGLRFTEPYWTALSHGMVAGLFGAACLWRFTLTEAERHTITSRLPRRRARPAAATETPVPASL